MNFCSSLWCILHHLQILRICLHILPKRLLVLCVRAGLQERRSRKPPITCQEIIVGLSGQKIRKQDVPKLMRKQTADPVIPFCPRPIFGDELMAGIDQNACVIRTGNIPVLGIPEQMHAHPAPVMVSPGLSCRHVLKMSRKDARGEELAVCNFAAFFIQQLFDSLVIHPCHFRVILLPRKINLLCGASAQKSAPAQN